jgi:hypothetical protein
VTSYVLVERRDAPVRSHRSIDVALNGVPFQTRNADSSVPHDGSSWPPARADYESAIWLGQSDTNAGLRPRACRARQTPGAPLVNDLAPDQIAEERLGAGQVMLAEFNKLFETGEFQLGYA